MISEKILKNLLGEKVYDNVLWEYDSELIQILKEKVNSKNNILYNLKYNNLKDKFDVIVSIKDEKFTGYCNCKEGKEGKACEHLLWAGIKINENEIQKNKTNELLQTTDYKLQILEELSTIKNMKDEIIIHTKIELLNEKKISIELKVELELAKTYKIIDINKFINDVKDNKKLKYGKYFETNNYQIATNSLNLFQTLDYLNLLFLSKNEKIDLNDLDIEFLPMILRALVNQYIEYQNDDFFVSDIIDDIALRVEQKKKGIRLIFNSVNDYNFIQEKVVVNFNNKTFYLIQEKDINKIKLLNSFQQRKDKILKTKQNLLREEEINYLDLENEEEKYFLKNILPQIYNEFNMDIDNQFEFEIIEEKLEIKLYCYLENRQIKIKPQFLYGVYNTDQDYNKKLIKRDIVRENKVYSNLLSQGYQYDVLHKEFYITVEKSQFLFLTKNIFEFKQEYIIELDEKLKHAILNFDKNSINVSINKNKSYDYFELNFDLGEIPTSEIDNILQSYEEKKIFHKLTNDTFLKLNDQRIYEQLLFVRDVIQNNSYKLNKYRIPEYKALLLNAEISQKFSKYTYNQEFENYLEKIKLIPPLADKVFAKSNYELRDYQKKGISWLHKLYEAKFGALLADEMGLGKTLQIISFLEIENITSGIIIMPKALLYNWKMEFEKFNSKQNIVIIEGNQKQRETLIEENINKKMLLTSYSSIINDYQIYKNHQFEVVILDEAQYIKNPQTKTARCTKMIQGKFFIALTGTPIENNLTEMWSIFDYIIPGYLNTLPEFNKKYKVEDKINNLDILKEATSPFIMRRLKREVLKELPDKIETNVYSPMEEEQKNLYYKFNQKYQEEINSYVNNNDYNNKNMEILSAITRLRQIAIDPSLFIKEYNNKSGKIEVFEELIAEIIKNEEKVIVFSQYTTMLKKLGTLLEEKDIKYYYLDGEVKPKQRLMDVERFNKNKVPVYLVSLKAGGVGLNLTSANNVIIFDPWWNPAIEDQAIDRTHRIGQKNKVQIFRIISLDTIEQKIQELKNDKKNIINQVLDNTTSDISKMSTEKMISLLLE